MRKFLRTMLIAIIAVMASMFAFACDDSAGSGDPSDPSSHEHTYATEWTYDDTQHWHVATCEHTDEKKDLANHTKVERITLAPTWTTKGKAKLACVCGWEGTEYELAIKDKLTPEYELPTLTATYGQGLADITLPEGFSWELPDGVEPSDIIFAGAGEIDDYKLSYIAPDDVEEKYLPVTGIEVTIAVAKATPVLELVEDSTVWVKDGIAIDPSWYAGSTEGTTAVWATPGNANPNSVGVHTIKLVYAESDNYVGAEESFEFTVVANPTISKAYSWTAYDAKTPTAVSYDRKIEAKHTRDGETNFNNFVAGVDYTENFNTDDEKGFSYKAQLTDDGLYFIATVKHDLILSGSSDWGSNNNIEGVLGNSKSFYLAVGQVVGTDVNSALASVNLASYSIEIAEATDKNYKYETVFTGLIPYSYLVQNDLIVEGENGKADHVRFALAYRSGTRERIVLCVPEASATIDTATNSETIVAGNYAFRTLSQNNLNDFVDGNKKDLTITDNKYMIGEDVVTLTRYQKNTATVDGEACYLYYVDYPDFNDSFYSTSAHTKAKPFIIYPEGHSPYVGAEHAYVTADGISHGYTATEAVIDGVADDELWANYHGYMMYAYEQGDALPSKSKDNSNARGRGVEVKAIVGDDGVYIYGVVTHSKHINYTHRTIWNNAIELQFALTPQTSSWDTNSSNNYKGSAGADEPFQLKSFVFTETGYELFAGTEYAFNTEWDGQFYVSKLEAFISWNVFQNKVSNGIPAGYDLRAGIQYRSFSEYIYVKGGSETTKNNIWTAHNTISDYGTGPNKFYHIDVNGLHAIRKTDTRFAVDGKMDDWKNTANYTGNVVRIADADTGKWVEERMVFTADGLYFSAEAETSNFWRHVKDSSPCMLLKITQPNGAGGYDELLKISAGGIFTTGLRGAPLKGFESISVGTQIEGASTETKDDDRYNVVIEGFIPMWFLKEHMGDKLLKENDEVVALDLLGFEFSPGAGDKNLEPFKYANWREAGSLGSSLPKEDGNMYVTSMGYSMTCPVHFHTYSNTWTYDENQHWHAATCEHDEEKKDLANHNKTEQVITAPTYKADGSAKLVCACGWAGEEYALPKKAKETPSYTVPTNLTATDQQTLADIVLPAGFAWELETGVTPDEVALTAGDQKFTLSYTVPNDTEERYLVVTGIEVTVTVTHIHTYADTLTFNDDQHWYASTCGHADEKKDVADHTKTEQIITNPTYTEDGSAKLVCACGWEGEEYVKPKLDQETPSYTVPTNLTATDQQTLADVVLPAGFTWELEADVTPDEVALTAGEQKFTVTYTEPNDPEGRFEPVTGIEVTVTVTHVPTYSDTWTFNDDQHWHASTCGHADEKKDLANHNKTEQVITEPTYKTEGSAKLVCACGWEGDEYELDKLAQETPSYTVPSGLTATYGDALASVALPAGFAWELEADVTPDEVILNAGDQEFTVSYTVPNDTEGRWKTVTGIQVIVEVAKATPVLVFNANTAVWTEEGIAIDPSWYAGSTEGTTATWTTDGGVNPTLVGTYTVKLTFEETDNYEGAEESFEFTVTHDTTMAAEYSWADYAGNNPSVVSYDPLINKYNVWNGSNSLATANVQYTENFDTANEKGFDYKAILTDDGLYFVATARHDVIRAGNSDWSLNTNIESNIYNANGGGAIGFHMAIMSVDGLTVTGADVPSMVTSYAIVISEAPAGANYQYVTEFKGLIPQSWLTANNRINANGNAMIHFGFRSGNDSRIVVEANATWDSATNTETITAGTYNYKTINQNTVASDAAGTVTLTNNEGQWTVDGRKVNLTIASKTANADGTYSFYLDYVDTNDVFYSLGAHTVAKPWIVYPKEYNIYGGASKAVHVGRNGMLWSYKATEAVIDGKADDTMWTNYNGGAITITEQRADLLASTPAGANFEGRNVVIKMVEGNSGIYVYAVARHNKFVDYMPVDNDAIFNTEFNFKFYLTPDVDAWNNAVTPVISKEGVEAYKTVSNVVIRASGDLTSNIEFCMTSSKASGDAYYTTILEAYIDFEYFGSNYSGPVSGYNLRVNATFGSAGETAALPGISSSQKTRWFNTLSNYPGWSNIDGKTTDTEYQKVPGYYYLVKGVGIMGKKRANDYAVDGDLSDWANYQGITQTFVDKNDSNKTVSYRAIRTNDGIYLASEAVTQNYYLYGGSNQSGTQLLLRVNGCASDCFGYVRNGYFTNGTDNGANPQFNEVATSVTKLENGYYKVVFEVFISNASWKEKMGTLPTENTPLLAIVFYANSDKGSDNFFYSSEYAALGNSNGRDWCASNHANSPTGSATPNEDGKMYVTTTGFSLTDPLAE